MALAPSLAAAAALLLAAPARPDPVGAADATKPADTFELRVDASGFDGEQGHAVALLFLPGADVLKKDQAHAVVTSPIHAAAARFSFPGLSPGRYAVVVFHDANDNGIIDHGLFGPIEQLGFSNGFRPGIRRGLPRFDKLQVDLSPPSGSGAVQLAIAVR